MTKMKASIPGIVAILTFTTVLVVHREAQNNLAQVRLREENEALREQLRQTQELARQQVRPEADSNSIPPLSSKQFRQLLRLRGVVGVLRERLAKADNERAQRQPSGQRTDANKDKVPALGDLPGMGGLLRKESNSVDPDPTGFAWTVQATALADDMATNAAINANRSGAVVGIGAELTLQDGYAVINHLLPGSPAELSGQINPGDRILAVAQGDSAFVDASTLSLSDLVQNIRGDSGTLVQLQILPAGAPPDSPPITVTLRRDQIKFKQ